MAERSFDICVIGAGPAGATAALLLARAGMSVAIVEKAVFPRRKVCGEYLSATTLDLFGKLGLLDDFSKMAGPEISRVGIFADKNILLAPMPKTKPPQSRWGRALRRDVLDEWLLGQAVGAGATVFQPWSVTAITRRGEESIVRLESKETADSCELAAGIVIAAHGSWEIGQLSTQAKKQKPAGSDLLGFKAHFRNTDLPPDLMPMLVFPGGYGGMASCDEGFVSLSCCVQRETLQEIRRRSPSKKAGDAVHEHILGSTKGVSDAISRADLCGEWLSAGPIRPGFRARYKDGVFIVGNAAGESHPIIAEGISMAIQSSWLLCERLLQMPKLTFDEAANAYDRDWLAAFGPRIKAANVFAYLALNTRGHSAMSSALSRFPSLLTAGAKLSGKVNRIVIDRAVAK
ncbi:MAG TPA: FAD-dependent oxidoreductase [Pyrinomonadaceae bacterium]|nr:FAD-dependent oxidoreductase [Pyrinomonadaceae bacterium]